LKYGNFLASFNAVTQVFNYQT